MLDFLLHFFQWYFGIGLLVQFGWFIFCCLFIGGHSAVAAKYRLVGQNERYYQGNPKAFVVLMYTMLIAWYPVFFYKLLRAFTSNDQTSSPEGE